MHFSGVLRWVAALPMILCVLCGTAVCQYAAEFSSYHNGKRYDFRLTQEQLAETPAWQNDEPNPPLSVRQAQMVGVESLKKLFDDGDKWRLNDIGLVPVADRWVYLIAFEEPPLPGCLDCLSFPFKIVVRMDGLAVPAIISPSK